MLLRRVALVQQGVWEMPVESMPLGIGYLKATALRDAGLRSELDFRLYNFLGGASPRTIAQRLFSDGVPDILALSVFGWNFQPFGALAETFRSINPDGWIIVGGTHVADQAQRTFGCFPSIDVVVNGEGEFVFADLMRAYLQGRSPRDLAHLNGISFQGPNGIETTPETSRIMDLDSIPSPFLDGVIEMTDEAGNFRYDVALTETNRGCPYRCAFCYWGGAIGQKVRKFSRDRLRAELDFFGFHKVQCVALCDANFGMFDEDMEFVEDMIRTREKRGYPRLLETSWAKNKSKTFFRIVHRLKEARLHSSFVLSLQSLTDEALVDMRRKNMKVNEWTGLAQWLEAEGLEPCAELIWGAPGDTFDAFLEGYDRLAEHVTKIAIYPMLVLPNCEYSTDRARFQLVTLRSPKDDFEYVLAHRTMSFEDNRRMNRFIFWARVFPEFMIMRVIWTPLRTLAGLTQSQILLKLNDWFERQNDPISVEFKKCCPPGWEMADWANISDGVRFIYRHIDQLGPRFADWWREEILPLVPPHLADFFADLFRYDQALLPIVAEPAVAPLPTVELDGETYYIRKDVMLQYDVPGIVAALKRRESVEVSPQPVTFDLYYKVGFWNYLNNHELNTMYAGRTADELRAAADCRAGEPGTDGGSGSRSTGTVGRQEGM